MRRVPQFQKFKFGGFKPPFRLPDWLPKAAFPLNRRAFARQEPCYQSGNSKLRAFILFSTPLKSSLFVCHHVTCFFKFAEDCPSTIKSSILPPGVASFGLPSVVTGHSLGFCVTRPTSVQLVPSSVQGFAWQQLFLLQGLVLCQCLVSLFLGALLTSARPVQGQCSVLHAIAALSSVSIAPAGVDVGVRSRTRIEQHI